jgi:signal transduction histidine kinase
MHSNQPRLRETIEEREEIKKLRIMLLSAAISYPLWGILSNYMAPSAYDPYWQRLACSFITLIALWLTYTLKDAFKQMTLFTLVGWLYSYHLLFLYWKNPDTAYYVICNLIQFAYVILCFSNKRDAQLYTYTKFFAIAIFACFVNFKVINPWFFVLSMVTIGHYMVTVLIQHFNVIADLKKTKQEFELSLSNMLEGVILLNSKGVINSYNNSAMNLLGFTEFSHIEKSFKETCLYTDSLKESLEKYAETDHPLVQVIREQKAIKNLILGVEIDDSRRWLQLNIQPLMDSDNILISFSDISNLKRNQDIKEKEQAQLAMNAKLSSLFKVAGGVAHEINNPLGIIITRLQSLERKLDDEVLDKELVKISIQKTVKAAFRIAKVVATLLNLSNSADEQPMVSVKLSEVVETTMHLCRENFRSHDIELIVDDIPDVALRCRPTQISQVFLNLLNNSFEATLGQEMKWARFSFWQDEEKVMIAISDGGPKIPDAVKERMMDPFFTTKDVGKGAGLGLSVSKAIIEEHEGAFYLDKESYNTSFIIELKKDLLVTA